MSDAVFGPVYAAHYDRIYAAKDYGAECDLVEEAYLRFSSAAGRRLLDIGCGTGRHAVEFASRGWEVCGVDPSPAMISLARSRAGNAGQKISFVEGNAREFETSQSFDLALMMFAVIGYLGATAEVERALANVRRQVATGALLIFDCWYGPAVLAQLPGERTLVMDSVTGRMTRHAQASLDESRQLVSVRYELAETAAGRVLAEVAEVHTMRYFFEDELRALLLRTGFEVRSATAFPSLDRPATTSDWNLFVVAAAC